MSTEYDKNLVQNNQNLSVALGETSLVELYKLIKSTKMSDVREFTDAQILKMKSSFALFTGHISSKANK